MAIKALSTINQIQFIDKHEFARVTLDENSETFAIQIVALKSTKMAIYLSQVAQLAVLQWDNIFTKVLVIY